MGGWNLLVHDTTRDCFYYQSWGGIMNKFDPVTGAWSNAGRAETGNGNGIHNRTYTYDPIRDRVWIGSGTGGVTGEYRAFWWSPATQEVVPISDTDPTNSLFGAPSYQSATYYYPPTDSIIAWGGWSDGYRTLRTRDWDSPYNTAWSTIPVTGTHPPEISEPESFTSFKSAYDSTRNRYITVSADRTLYILDGNLTNWTTATVLPYNGTEYPGITTHWVYDDTNDQLIGWMGNGQSADGSRDWGGEHNTTWRIKLGNTPLQFEKMASASFGDAMPLSGGQVSTAVIWDKIRKRLFWVQSGNGFNSYQIWVYYPPVEATSRWTGFPLPTASGSTWGVNYHAIPYATNRGSKHSEMAYCPLNGRLYAGLGDTAYSNALQMWSMDLTTGQWRFEAGYDRTLISPLDDERNYPYRFPNGYQDECLFQWSPYFNKFIIGFTGPFPYYTPEGSIQDSYARGVHFYDPTQTPANPAAAFTTDYRLFDFYFSPGTGNASIHDQCYHENTNTVWKFDPTNDYVASWDLTTFTRNPDINLGAAWRDGPYNTYSLSYRNAFVFVGDWLYTIGNLADRGVFKVCLMRFNVITRVAQKLAYPPMNPNWPSSALRELEYRIGHSNGKIVWVVHDGSSLGTSYAVMVYDIATDTWTEDLTRPSGGNLVLNAMCTLPDGRIAMCGSNQQPLTHIWFYEAL
jgi:hypothetical protein